LANSAQKASGDAAGVMNRSPIGFSRASAAGSGAGQGELTIPAAAGAEAVHVLLMFGITARFPTSGISRRRPRCAPLAKDSSKTANDAAPLRIRSRTAGGGAQFFSAVHASGVRALLIGRRALALLGLPLLTGTTTIGSPSTTSSASTP
jgi:hypothetical protein